MNPIITVESLYLHSRDQPIETPILKDVISLLQSNPGITIKQISARLGLNRNALSFSVKMLTGLTLVAFLKQWRLMLVKELLSDQSLSYEEVACHCGFSTVHNMSKFIDRMIHLTAYEYREGKSNGHRVISGHQQQVMKTLIDRDK